jgi:hypothetical protein
MDAPSQLLLIQLPLLGLDSFVAGLLVGPVLKPWGRRVGLAVAFGSCDGIGTLGGAVLSHSVPDIPEVAVYVLAVSAVLLAARRSAWWLAAVPAVLALDNLAAGAPAELAPALAVSSGLMAWTGMALSGLAWSVRRNVLARVRPPSWRARRQG